MKTYLLSFMGLFLFGPLCAQSEFTTYKNGLIYNEKTMGKLHRIVDSLNLKYKSCELNRTFYSSAQAIGHVIRLDTGNIKEARKDMELNLPIEDFRKKYPKATIENDMLIVRLHYKNYDGEEVVEYDVVSMYNLYAMEIVDKNRKPQTGKANTWLYEYSDSSEYSPEYLNAYYFINDIASKPLKEIYARRIGYADCLIDTTTAKFKENATSGESGLPKNWQSLSEKKKEKLLDEMRSTKVVGFCSMDESPRFHAVNIALLSAETTNWEVFLKSHLDIMNDRFDRMSDGSYAQGKRQTYIKELEELDINVQELLLGISLRIENPPKNHYYGNIGRLGRAISESKDKEAFEKEIRAMIADPELDDYNRVIAYFLFRSYVSYLYDENRKAEKYGKLKDSLGTLPAYLKDGFELKED